MIEPIRKKLARIEQELKEQFGYSQCQVDRLFERCREGRDARYDCDHSEYMCKCNYYDAVQELVKAEREAVK